MGLPNEGQTENVAEAYKAPGVSGGLIWIEFLDGEQGLLNLLLFLNEPKNMN